MRTVKLYGELGRRFGRVHRFDVASPAEAVRALSANFHGFERALLAHPIGFHVLAGRDDRADRDSLAEPVGEGETIKIIPATAGSKNGLLQTILGVVLVVAGTYFGQGWAVQLGVGLILGGVAQMLTPTPKYQAAQDDQTVNSYVFSGPVNTSAQGVPVPVGYGRMIVGSAVVSLGLSIQDLPL